MHVHLTTRQITQPADVIEVKMPQEDDVNIVCREAEFREIARNSLFLRHARMLEHRAHGRTLEA